MSAEWGHHLYSGRGELHVLAPSWLNMLSDFVRALCTCVQIVQACTLLHISLSIFQLTPRSTVADVKKLFHGKSEHNVNDCDCIVIFIPMYYRAPVLP